MVEQLDAWTATAQRPPLIDTRPANRESCPMLDILTLPETLAALIGTAGVIVCVVAWYCWRD